MSRALQAELSSVVAPKPRQKESALRNLITFVRESRAPEKDEAYSEAALGQGTRRKVPRAHSPKKPEL